MEEAKREGFADIPPIGMAGYLRPEYRSHLARLQGELEDVRPNVIVPLGSTALWALTGRTSIGSERGTISTATRLVPGAKIMPTFHPSFVMRQWKFFTVVVADFIRAFNEGAYPEVRIPFKELIIEPSIQDILDYLPRLYASDLLSVDIETGWGQITCIGFAPDSEHAICVPFVDLRKPDKSFYSPSDEAKAWRIVADILKSDVPKLGQNFAGYDFKWLFDHGLEPRNLKHDTRLAHHALYPELPKDLEFMGASYTTQGAWKNWGRKSQEKRDA
jgi:hypothetical protein